MQTSFLCMVMGKYIAHPMEEQTFSVNSLLFIILSFWVILVLCWCYIHKCYYGKSKGAKSIITVGTRQGYILCQFVSCPIYYTLRRENHKSHLLQIAVLSDTRYIHAYMTPFIC